MKSRRRVNSTVLRFFQMMMKPFLATLFLILSAPNAPAQLAKIAGIVVDPQPARITQAKVIVEGKRDRQEFTTDEEGFFQGNVQPGWYVITVSHYGFETRKLKLFLKPDVVTPLNVTLTLPGYKSYKCPKGTICL
jgi:hypothetical protein